MKKKLTRWVVAVVVGFLLMAPHLRMFGSEPNRYFGFWGRSDAVAFTVIFVLLGTALFLLYEAARWTGSRLVVRVAQGSFVAVTCLAVVAILRSGTGGHGALWGSLKLAGQVGAAAAGVAGLIAVAFRRNPMQRVARAGCLIVAPIVPLVLLQMFSYPQFSVAQERWPEGAEAGVPGRAGDVYVFVFDACSYDRLLNDRDVAKATPNVARLTARATVYNDAHSVYPETFRSLPSILFGTADEYTLEGGGLYFRTEGGELEPVSSRRSVFEEMSARGYRTFMVGWTHPYRQMLGGVVDYCFSYPFKEGNADDGDIEGNIERHLWYGFVESSDALPLPGFLRWRVNDLTGRTEELGFAVARVGAIHQRAMSIVGGRGRARFGVFHYPVPHAPYVFCRAGADPGAKKRWPLDFTERHGGLSRPDPANHVARYRGNLDYMDTLLGEVLDALASGGRLDDAMIVLTADHGWRVDPLHDHVCVEHHMALGMIRTIEPPPAELTHVPLIVKFPRQAEERRVGKTFSLADLEGLICRTVDGR